MTILVTTIKIIGISIPINNIFNSSKVHYLISFFIFIEQVSLKSNS